MRTFALLFISALAGSGAVRDFDVVVYGGTAGGVIAAVAAAREGMKTALLEPGAHLGGMVSSGLGWTDYGKKEVIGGYALEFYYRVGRHYQMPLYGQDLAWLHEPHVAEDIFRAHAAGRRASRCSSTSVCAKRRRPQGRRRIAAIRMENGDEFTAKVFIDSSYEGDLMAQAGMTYTYGREASAQYGESLAGVRDRDAVSPVPGEYSAHGRRRQAAAGDFLAPIAAARDRRQGRAVVQLPHVLLRRPGESRHLLQARRIRSRALRIARAPDRAPARNAEGRAPALEFADEDRAAFRTARPTSTTTARSPPTTSAAVGITPNATYAERERIWQAHKDYQAGLLLFPGQRSAGARTAAPGDEPLGLVQGRIHRTPTIGRTQLYIREARRMVGEYVMVQKDLQTDLHQARPHRHGLLQQRFAQRGAHRRRRWLRAQRGRYAGGA